MVITSCHISQARPAPRWESGMMGCMAACGEVVGCHPGRRNRASHNEVGVCLPSCGSMLVGTVAATHGYRHYRAYASALL